MALSWPPSWKCDVLSVEEQSCQNFILIRFERRRTILVAIWDQFWSKNIAQSRSNIKCALRWPPISKQNYFRDGPTYRDNAHTTCSLAKHATSQPSAACVVYRVKPICRPNFVGYSVSHTCVYRDCLAHSFIRRTCHCRIDCVLWILRSRVLTLQIR